MMTVVIYLRIATQMKWVLLMMDGNLEMLTQPTVEANLTHIRMIIACNDPTNNNHQTITYMHGCGVVGGFIYLDQFSHPNPLHAVVEDSNDQCHRYKYVVVTRHCDINTLQLFVLLWLCARCGTRYVAFTINARI